MRTPSLLLVVLIAACKQGDDRRTALGAQRAKVLGAAMKCPPVYRRISQALGLPA